MRFPKPSPRVLAWVTLLSGAASLLIFVGQIANWLYGYIHKERPSQLEIRTDEPHNPFGLFLLHFDELPFEVTFKEQVGLETHRVDVSNVFVSVIKFVNSGDEGFDWNDRVREPITVSAGEGKSILLARRWPSNGGTVFEHSPDRNSFTIKHGFMKPGEYFLVAVAFEANLSKQEDDLYKVAEKDRLTFTGDIKGQPLIVLPDNKPKQKSIYAVRSVYGLFALTGMIVAVCRMRLHRIISSQPYRKKFLNFKSYSEGQMARLVSSCVLYIAFTGFGYLFQLVIPTTSSDWTWWASLIVVVYLGSLAGFQVLADHFEYQMFSHK